MALVRKTRTHGFYGKYLAGVLRCPKRKEQCPIAAGKAVGGRIVVGV